MTAAIGQWWMNVNCWLVNWNNEKLALVNAIFIMFLVAQVRDWSQISFIQPTAGQILTSNTANFDTTMCRVSKDHISALNRALMLRFQRTKRQQRKWHTASPSIGHYHYQLLGLVLTRQLEESQTSMQPIDCQPVWRPKLYTTKSQWQQKRRRPHPAY